MFWNRKFHNCRKNHHPFAVGGSFRHNAGGTGAEIEWQQMASILWGNKFSIRSYSIHSFLRSFVRSFVHSFVPCYCSQNLLFSQPGSFNMCSPFFVYHSVVFQYLAETHLCPVCEMISLPFVLPASRLQHSVRLGTAGFSMSGKKGTDIEALGLLTAVLCRLIYFHLLVPRRNPWVCCSWWSPYSVTTSGVMTDACQNALL